VPHAEVLYGPRRVFPEGRYRITLRYRAESAQGDIGSFRVREPMSSRTDPLTLPGNQTSAEIEVTLSEPLPLVVSFNYTRQDTVHIEAVDILRLE